MNAYAFARGFTVIECLRFQCSLNFSKPLAKISRLVNFKSCSAASCPFVLRVGSQPRAYVSASYETPQLLANHQVRRKCHCLRERINTEEFDMTRIGTRPQFTSYPFAPEPDSNRLSIPIMEIRMNGKYRSNRRDQPRFLSHFTLCPITNFLIPFHVAAWNAPHPFV